MFGMIPLPVKLFAAVAIIGGAFLYGYMKGSAYAEAELARFSARAAEQVAQLERENLEISNRVQVEYVDRVQTIREKEYVYVDTAQNTVAGQYDLSNGWVHTHDASASNDDADPARAADESPSGIIDNQALITIARNYSRCEANAEQLRQLQRWIRDNKAAVDRANAEAEKKK